MIYTLNHTLPLHDTLYFTSKDIDGIVKGEMIQKLSIELFKDIEISNNLNTLKNIRQYESSNYNVEYDVKLCILNQEKFEKILKVLNIVKNVLPQETHEIYDLLTK
jgi:hypothetical protein